MSFDPFKAKAIFTFDKETHIFVVWYIKPPAEANTDVMGFIWHDKDKNLHIRYRHRYYKTDKAFTGEDKFNVYDIPVDPKIDPKQAMAITKQGWEEIINQAKSGASILQAPLPVVELDWLVIDGDVHKFAKMVKNKPWWHIKERR